MRRAGVAVLAVALAGACTSSVGPYVKNLWVEDAQLVVEKCNIEYTSPMGGMISERDCFFQRIPLPARLEVTPSPAPPPSQLPGPNPRCEYEITAWRAERDLVKKTELYNAMPDDCRAQVTRKEPSSPGLPAAPSRKQILAELRTASDAIMACAKRAGASSAITLTFTVTSAGDATRLSLDVDDPALRSCIERALRGVQFPKSRNGATVSFPFYPGP